MSSSYEYQGKFTLNKGDMFYCRPRSYYTDQNGVRYILGSKGKFIFVDVAQDGIIARQSGNIGTEYIYLGPERVSPKTGTVMKAHVLSIPKKPKKESAIKRYLKGTK